jgi:hypothetical protein
VNATLSVSKYDDTFTLTRGNPTGYTVRLTDEEVEVGCSSQGFA